MKIASVEAIPVGIPFTWPGPPLIFLGKPRMVYEFLLIKVVTESGLVGYGESTQAVWRPVQAVIEDFIAPAITGRDASDINRLMRQLRQMLHTFGTGNGIVMFAVSAVDIALWDLAGKAAGLPLHRLLGSASPPPMAGYASLGWYRGPEVVASATRAAIEAGYRHVKLHSVAEEEVRAAREVAGEGVPLMVDASARWTPQEAREAARRLEPLDIFWLEEPIFPPEDFAALARLRAETAIPIAAGENVCTSFEFNSMLAAGAVNYATPAVNKVGGITEFRKAAALAEAHGVELVAQIPCHGPAFLASLHLMAAHPGRALIERFFCTLEAPLGGPAALPVDGQFRVPEGPGLGHDPDPDLIREYRLRP